MPLGKEDLPSSHSWLPQGRAEEQSASFMPGQAVPVPCPLTEWHPGKSSSCTPVLHQIFLFLEAARIRNPHKYSPGVVRKLLTAVLMKGPCSSAVLVSAQDVITPGMERGVLFKREEVKVDFNKGEKNKSLLSTFSIANMAFSRENLNTKIFEPKNKVFNFWQLRTGLGCSIFDSEATYIRTVFFLPLLQNADIFKCIFSQNAVSLTHFQQHFFHSILFCGFLTARGTAEDPRRSCGNVLAMQTLRSGLEWCWTPLTPACGSG